MSIEKDLFVFFDADCGFCQSTINWMAGRDVEHKLHFVSYQTPQLDTLYPQVELEHSDRGIQCINPKGHLFKNEKAIALCLFQLPRYRWMGRFILFPLFRPLCSLGYRIISANRQRISRLLGFNSCKLNACKLPK